MSASQRSHSMPTAMKTNASAAAGACRNAGGAGQVEAELEQRAEDTTAVEGERGDHVERRQQEVEPGEPWQPRTVDEVDRIQRVGGRDCEQGEGQAQRPRWSPGPRSPSPARRVGSRAAIRGVTCHRSAAGRSRGPRGRAGGPRGSARAHGARRNRRSSPAKPDDVGNARPVRCRAGHDEERHEHEEAGVHADLDARDPRDRERPAPASASTVGIVHHPTVRTAPRDE